MQHAVGANLARQVDHVIEIGHFALKDSWSIRKYGSDRIVTADDSLRTHELCFLGPVLNARRATQIDFGEGDVGFIVIYAGKAGNRGFWRSIKHNPKITRPR